jgi:hypothetical protein
MGQEHPGGLAQAAAGPVTDDGAADLFGGGKAFADLRTRRGAAAALNHHDPLAVAVTPCHKKKFTPHPEAFNLKWRRVDVGWKGPSGSGSA